MYELTGTIASIVTEYDSQYNNISFILSDGVNEVQIFRMSCDGIADPSKISVGDGITVRGTRSSYQGTAQMAKDSKCIEFIDNDAQDDDLEQPGEVGQTYSYTFTSKSWGDETESWTSGADGNAFTTGQGVRVTVATTGANATCKTSMSKVSSVIVNYCTNSSTGVGTIKITIGGVTKAFTVTKTGGTTLREATFDFSSELPSGNPKIEVECTTNSIYINSITFNN